VLQRGCRWQDRLDGASLLLADREVSAAEISAHGPAPSLAVVSACLGARSDDDISNSPARWYGVSRRWLAARGCDVAPVNDQGATEVITRFYRKGGVADPARALAAAQAELVKTNNTDWPYFAVFGPDVCP